jgi:hypothetical protein
MSSGVIYCSPRDMAAVVINISARAFPPHFVFDWDVMRGRHLDGLALRCAISDRRIASIEMLPVRRNEHNDICVHGADAVAGKEILGRFEQLSKKLGTTIVLAAGNRLELGTTTQSNAAPARVRATA